MKSLTDNSLKTYFEEELDYLRHMGAKFHDEHSQVADRLGLGSKKSTDPHIEALLQSFAFLTGRLQYQLHAEAPQIPSALLEILYPYLEAPIPSMTVAQFIPDKKISETGSRLQKHSIIYKEFGKGGICKFRTCYPTDLWPIKISAIGLKKPQEFAFLESLPKVESVLSVTLETQNKEQVFSSLPIESLRFYLSGDERSSYLLYELLTNHVSNVVFNSDSEKEQRQILSDDVIQPVGFANDEAVLPEYSYSHPAYRILQEYFVFPNKFKFLDVVNFNAGEANQKLEILFLLDKEPPRQVRIDMDSLALGCAPVINLFPKITEPIRLNHQNFEYKLLGDRLWNQTVEIYSIEKVESQLPDGKRRIWSPLFSYNQQEREKDQNAFWFKRREVNPMDDPKGTEIYLSFYDESFSINQEPNEVVFANSLCTNRDLPRHFAAGETFNYDGEGSVEKIVLLEKPSPHRNPKLHGKAVWQLISNLSLNHLSLTDGEVGLEALKNILFLYAPGDDLQGKRQINSLNKLICKSGVNPIGKGADRKFCYGIEITLTINESTYIDGQGYLFGSVLNRFFSLYASINSYTQLTLKNSMKEKEDWKKWQPMAGGAELL